MDETLPLPRCRPAPRIGTNPLVPANTTTNGFVPAPAIATSPPMTHRDHAPPEAIPLGLLPLLLRILGRLLILRRRLHFLMLPLYRRKEVARFVWTDYSHNWRQLLQVG